MIDLHCHLLPGVDDGAGDLEESLAMARLAAADGIRAIVATPHFLNGVYHHSPKALREHFLRFQEFLAGQQVALSLYPGADIHLAPDLIRHLEGQELPAINNRRYLLLELPSFALPSALHDTLFHLRTRGFTPIITHPERNGSIQENPDQVVEMNRFGALVQVTAMSLTGEFGKKVTSLCRCLAGEGIGPGDGHGCPFFERKAPYPLRRTEGGRRPDRPGGGPAPGDGPPRADIGRRTLAGRGA